MQVAQRIAQTWPCGIIYTSPLRRCHDTGSAIASSTNASLATLEDLNDLDYGQWQGKGWDEARMIDARLFEAWRNFPDKVVFPSGESLQDVAARAARALRHVRQLHANETTVMVSHDSVNRVILSLALSLPLSSYWRLTQDPCCINEIEYTDHGPRVCRVNDAAHITR